MAEQLEQEGKMNHELKETTCCSSRSEDDDDDVLVESIVDNVLNKVNSGDTSEESTTNVIKSRAFVYRNDVLESEMSGLRIRPESPTTSYTSTSFESLHSEELDESCPLIFRVDDVGPPPTLKTETIQNTGGERQGSKFSKANEDLEGKVQSDTVITDFIANYGHVHGASSGSSENKSEIELSQMFTDKSYVFESNLMNNPLHLPSESKSSHYQPYNIRMSGATDGSPEYIINQLEDNLFDLSEAISEFPAHNTPNATESLETTELKRGCMERVQKLAEITQETWKKHKEYLLDVLGDFDKLESKLFEETGKFTNQSELSSKLKNERRELQAFIEDREKEWSCCERSLKLELQSLRSKLYEISQKNLESGNVFKMMESFMDLQFNREQAIVLDTMKQNKINELRLLVYRQQLLIEELQEDNLFLQQEVASYIASDPLFEDTRSEENYNNNGMNSIVDVLYCDRHQYLPFYSKHPALASLQVFNIGGRHPKLKAYHEEVFNPMNLNIYPPGSEYTEDELNQLYEQLKQYGPASSQFTLDD